MTLQLPHTIDGYELVKVIGGSSFGTVFRARHPKGGKEIALKWAHPDCVSDPDPTEARDIRAFRLANPELIATSYQREVEINARMHHPYVNLLMDHGHAEEWPYLVTELQPNALDRLLAEKGRLSPDEAVRIARQICQALVFARDHAVVHRDIKPSNILLTKDGTAKVSDFGISKALDTLAKETLRAWRTWGYAPPEQAGEQADARMDVYALGVTLFEMLTGKLPYGRTEDEVTQGWLRCKETGQVPGPRDLISDVPPWLHDAVQRAIRLSAAERWQTATDFLAALNEPANRPSAAQTESDRWARIRVKPLDWQIYSGLVSDSPRLTAILFTYKSELGAQQARQVFRDVAEEYLDWDFMETDLFDKLGDTLEMRSMNGPSIAVVKRGRTLLRIDRDWSDTKEHLMEKLAAADALAEKLAAADALARKSTLRRPMVAFGIVSFATVLVLTILALGYGYGWWSS